MAILRAANESLLSLRVEGLPDDELRVLRMHGEEGLSRLFEFDLELVSENPAIPFANVVGQPATLTFSTVGADRPVNGLVRRFEQGAITDFDTVYRFERLAGRYADNEAERKAPRTVHALSADAGIDFWDLLKKYHRYLPLADALYGSAAYVPMADGAQYVVSVSATGLLIRPLNDAAQKAVGGWK